MKNARKKPGSRHGKHHPDKVIIGCFVTPEEKALAKIVSSMRGCTISSLLVDGVHVNATALGLEVNGVLMPDVKSEVNAVAAVVREEKLKRQTRGERQ